MKYWPAGAVIVICVVATPRAQTPAVVDAALPRFDAASVKPGDPSDLRAVFDTSPGQYRMDNVPLTSILAQGFGIPPERIEGAPAWVRGEKYFIRARAPQGRTRADLMPMVRALLIDRFKLRYHIEQREGQGYHLVVARADGQLGPQLRRSSMTCSPDAKTPRSPDCRYDARPGNIDVTAFPIALLAGMLSSYAEGVVVDRTALEGDFDYAMKWNRTSLGAVRDTARTSDGPSIFTALSEQLGLKLEPARLQIDHLIVDAISRPDPD
jgi:uncharacterized protein (TIGR03435 family)